MKITKFFAVMLVIITLLSVLASCGNGNKTTTADKPSINAPTSSATPSESMPVVTPSAPTETPSNSGDEMKIITVAEAIALCTSETPTEERYYLKGTVKSLTNPQYGEMILEDATGTLKIYGTYSADGAKRYSELEEKPVAGDEVLLYVNLCLYDGETGSYVYTMCSGADFAWLDAFDGKICTVYLSLLNAKSTASGCLWRFLPIAVKDEGFTFNMDQVAEFIVNYHAVDLFKSEYTGDPQLVLHTAVSSDLLGFRNATLTYTSSDESIVYFENGEDGLIMHTRAAGTAKITVTGSYNGKTFAKELTVTNKEAVIVNGITVAEAYAAAMESKVTVTGIVGASVVNKTGFYLIDETGAIAVTVSAETLATLEIGQKVTITGTRTNTVGGKLGQSCILDATVDANYYGKYDYSSASFKNATLADIMTLERIDKNTETVYVLDVKIKKVETNFYTNYYLTDGTNEFLLYASNGSQYSWIEQYGESIKVELAICNWNGKALRGALLAIVLPDGSKVVNDLNFR